MDFESPDVAKEFPGLYMGDLEVGKMSEGLDYDEDDKSKKKKDKKKDKEKGYAALAGESSHDEDDESKSPGKSKKIKAFKLTGGKKKDKDKEKDKDKDKEHKPAESRTHSLIHATSILRTGSLREKRPFDRERKPLSEKELRKSAEKEIKSKSAKSSSSSSAPASAHGSVNPRLSLPTSSTSKITHPAPERTNSLTKNLTLNAFLNAPAPLLRKKETASSISQKEAAKKEKLKNKEESKKSKESMQALVRLKLKRGSKNSLEESQTGDSSVAPSHQFPESPDAIAREIRRYEVLLEQSHAQIKASKKVSKKSEEQLWELQRTLTQLKRKLRSVNALSSASSANIVLPNTADKSGNKEPEKLVGSAANVVQPCNISAAVPSTSTSASATAPIPIPKPAQPDPSTVGVSSSSPKSSDVSTSDLPHQPKVDETRRQSSVKSGDLKSDSLTSVSAIDRVYRDSIPTDTSVDSKDESHVEEANAGLAEMEENEKRIEFSKSPGESSLGRIQVQVQVHNNEKIHRENLLTPEDVFEKEMETVDGNSKVQIARCPSPCPIAMRHHQNPIEVTNLTPDGFYDDSEASEIGSIVRYDNDSDDSDFSGGRPHGGNMGRSRSAESLGSGIPAFIVVEEPKEFDPYAVPAFHTDEFIALENAALIGFNQKIQNEIVKEEERVTALTEEFKALQVAGCRNSALEDLEALDDDELAELWYSRKMENEVLHERVSQLRSLLVAGILDEFRLETRLQYLREKMLPTTATDQHIDSLLQTTI